MTTDQCSPFIHVLYFFRFVSYLFCIETYVYVWYNFVLIAFCVYSVHDDFNLEDDLINLSLCIFIWSFWRSAIRLLFVYFICKFATCTIFMLHNDLPYDKPNWTHQQHKNAKYVRLWKSRRKIKRKRRAFNKIFIVCNKYPCVCAHLTKCLEHGMIPKTMWLWPV